MWHVEGAGLQRASQVKCEDKEQPGAGLLGGVGPSQVELVSRSPWAELAKTVVSTLCPSWWVEPLGKFEGEGGGTRAEI